MNDPLTSFFKFLVEKSSYSTVLIGLICILIVTFCICVYFSIKDLRKQELERQRVKEEKEKVEKAEKILCAATWFDDGKEYLYQPINIKTGLVFCGYRHPTIFQQIGGSVKERQELGKYEKEQGFLTDQNRFVGREEALQIALYKGQVKNVEEVRGNRLHSEDLY